MKYTVIVGGNPFTILSEKVGRHEGKTVFFDGEGEDAVIVAEFQESKVEGIIMEDNNLNED